MPCDCKLGVLLFTLAVGGRFCVGALPWMLCPHSCLLSLRPPAAGMKEETFACGEELGQHHQEVDICQMAVLSYNFFWRSMDHR